MLDKLLGKKIGMTRYFLEAGKSVPVTVLKVGPCVVVQKKSKDKEGYDAVQIGYEARKDNRVNRPLQGHFRAAGAGSFHYLREVRIEEPENYELGQAFKSDVFNVGDRVDVIGQRKGRGFSGVMKRWGFSGGKKTHGSRTHRIPGAIGCSATPSRVQKGRKMPGRMGPERVTVRNLEIVDVKPESDLVAVKGAVPGGRNSLVEIRKS